MASNDSISTIRSVVLIDDDEDFLHVMKRRLQKLRADYAPAGPVDIATYTDPVEALVKLPGQGICVIIIDFTMPDGTALDWIPKLVQAGIGPVLVVTNRSEASIAAEAFRAGASDYVAKSDIMDDEKLLGQAIRGAVHRFRLEASNLVLTRQLKLLNAELEIKNKRLKELTDTAHQFVDDVAHDLRTPLTVIHQYASIVVDGISGPVNDAQRGHLELITDAAHELAEMVDDFLDSSKLRAGALFMDRKSHTVRELFESVEPMLAARADAKQIKIDCAIDDPIPPFFGDLSKICRIVLNLGINAIKVTPPGTPLHLWAKSTESGDVQIGVTDEGPGLSAESLNLIFQRFKQLESAQTPGAKGFGLGLSIVKQLTQINLGRVEVKSAPDNGSTFAVTFPADKLRNIVTSYLRTISTLDKQDDIRVLRATSLTPNVPAEELRRLISTFCYPMDIVLANPEQATVHVIGASRDVESWIAKLRSEISNFRRDAGAPPINLEIKLAASWPWDADDSKLLSRLMELVKPELSHV
ncbi:MAG TPA: ATP-binding protein [Tepidisphaeraceae bacterium]|nr:ATP-binding protein [Tepidisphaeraceae bacterium]